MSSKIIAEVKTANEKLAQYLLTKEEEENFLAYRKRGRTPTGGEKKVRTNRWAYAVDLRVPSGLVDRPSTPVGRTSFHFGHEMVSKVGPLPCYADGQPIQWAAFKGQTSPAEHAAYIEDYPLSSKGPSYPPSELVPTTAKPTDDIPDGRAATRVTRIYSNISDDPGLRDLYWKQVPAQESEVRTCNLAFNFESSPLWWAGLSGVTSLDTAFKCLALAEREAFELNRRSGVQGRSKSFNCSFADANDILQQIEASPGFDPQSPPVRYETRGGRMQVRLVLGLPHELGVEHHLKILKGLCDHLGGIDTTEAAVDFERHEGMMFTGVIHKPDKGNDRRNYHLHIVAHDRPAILVEAEDGPWWLFAPKKLQATRDIELIDRLRTKAEKVVNEQLQSAGVDRRYDARSYKEMRIERTPTKHLGKDAHALDSAGVHTPRSAYNGVVIWRDAERQITKELERERQDRDLIRSQISMRGSVAFALGPERRDTELLIKALGLRDGLVRSMEADRRELLLIELNEAKAKSRAKRLLLTTKRHLDDLASGQAEPEISAQSCQIKRKHELASECIQRIDLVLADHRHSIDQLRVEVGSQSARLKAFDRVLAAFAAEVSQAAEHDWAEVPLPAELKAYFEPQAPEMELAPKERETVRSETEEPLYSEPPRMDGTPICDPVDKATDERSWTAELASEDPTDLVDPSEEIEISDRSPSPLEEGSNTRKLLRPDDELLTPHTRDQSRAEPGLGADPSDGAHSIGGHQEHGAEPIEDLAGEPLRAHLPPPDGAASREPEPRPQAPDQGSYEIDVEGPAHSRVQKTASTPQKPCSERPLAGASTPPELPTDAPSPDGAAEAKCRLRNPLQATSKATGGNPTRAKLGAEIARMQTAAQTPRLNSEARPPAAVEANSDAVESRPLTPAFQDVPKAKAQPSGPQRTEGHEADLEAWERAFRYIETEACHIKREDGHLIVEDLPAEHEQALAQEALAAGTVERLKTAFAVQEDEVGEVLSLLRDYLADPTVIIIDEDSGGAPSARIADGFESSLRDKFHRRSRDPRVSQMIVMEHEEREEFRRQQQAHVLSSGMMKR